MAIINGDGTKETLNGMSGADVISGGEGGDTLNGGGGGDIIYGFGASDADVDPGLINATRIATGLSRPVFAASAPGDADRLFVIEQHSGQIKILDLATNQVNATPFLDIDNAGLSTGNEQGLLGLAFAPDYASSGVYYVNLTNAAGATEVWRYTRGADEDVSATTRQLVISFNGTAATNHNGGWMGFGPDNMLYIATGDGGPGDDPENNAQDIDSLFGKILRLDVSGDDFPADANRNYAIPNDNPYVGVAGADEIFAIGLRNPWRISFDPTTGDMIIADVGQNAREEINFVPDGTLGGRNFGWVVREGSLVNDDTRPGNPPANSGDFTHPIYDYTRGTGPYQGFAVTGGYVVRGPDAGAQGLYVFADYVSDNVWTMRINDSGQAEDVLQRNGQIRTSAGTLDNIVSFALDGQNRLYALGLDGEIFRLNFTAGAGDGADTIFGGAGSDQVFGGIGNDVLRGETGDDVLNGGAGADDMRGASGNDTYVVNVVGDLTVEAANAGTDTVRSTISWSLASNVERLVLLGGNLNGTGNGLVNSIYGTGGVNTLDGGAGADRMVGYGGNDTYVVDNMGDVVVEAVNNGVDTISASVSQVLAANVERLVLTGVTAINGTGNALDNILTGNSAKNWLNGGGGADTLTGGGGADSFIFNTAPGASNVDAITDYNVAADVIRLDNAVFSALGAAGMLAAAAFTTGAAAQDADDRIIYDSVTGALHYDADGNGAGAAVQIATLAAGLAMSSGEFIVI